jgi:curli biogenesis system outer membrane secretion channel CsgG
MGRHATPVSEKEKQRIIAASASGVPMAHLHASGRFPGVSRKTMEAIANEAKAKRRQCSRKGTPLPLPMAQLADALPQVDGAIEQLKQRQPSRA